MVHHRAAIDVDAVVKDFHTTSGVIRALNGVSLTIGQGTFVCLLGPSGCGKSTLLLLVAGLEKATAGHVTISGRTITGPYTDLGIVFQRDLLLEWRTALDNVLLQVDLRRYKRRGYRDRAQELLAAVGVGDFAHHYPRQLSGGMRQRVSICRALVHDPPLLLMDEPFGALDALTREQLNLDLARLVEGEEKTIFFITHSIEEAVFLGDRVLVMSPRPGRIIEDLTIDLPRPRTESARDLPAFGAHVRRLREILVAQGVLRGTLEGVPGVTARGLTA